MNKEEVFNLLKTKGGFYCQEKQFIKRFPDIYEDKLTKTSCLNYLQAGGKTRYKYENKLLHITEGGLFIKPM